MILGGEHRELELEALREAPPPSLLHDPIEYIFADHFRQRTLCNVLDMIAGADEVDSDLVEASLAFLKGDFGVHVLDEELDLFPLLQKLVQTDTEFLDVLKRLHQEHDQDRIDASRIVQALEDCLTDKNPPKLGSETKALLQRFAANERQHLMTENAIVLPIARTQLSQTDLVDLGAKMAKRRGIRLEEAVDAE